VRLLDSREAAVVTDKDGAAVLNGDKGRPADHNCTQTLIPRSRMIPGHLGHIAHGVKVQIRTSGHDKAEIGVDSTRVIRDHKARTARVGTRISGQDKAEVEVDSTRILRDHRARMARVGTRISGHDKEEAGVESTRIFRGHEVHIARMARVPIRIFKGCKIEAPADLTGISRAEDRVDTTRIFKVEVKDHAARALDVRT